MVQPLEVMTMVVVETRPIFQQKATIKIYQPLKTLKLLIMLTLVKIICQLG